MGELERDCWEVDPLYLPAILQRLERQVRPGAPNDKDASLLDGFPLYWVDKGNKESKGSFRRPRSPDNMGALDKDLCFFWKSVADANITFLTTTLITFEFFDDQLEVRIG